MATYVTALLVGMASFSLITTATTYESGSSQSSSSAANGPSETKAGSLVIASDLIDFGVESFPAQATNP